MNDKLKNYAKAVAAFAEGKPIEVFSIASSSWGLFESESNIPPTYECWGDFRVAKPKLKYRLARITGDDRSWLVLAASENEATCIQSSPLFDGWATDWLEV